jgi:protein O-GlcNAc transferase
VRLGVSNKSQNLLEPTTSQKQGMLDKYNTGNLDACLKLAISAAHEYPQDSFAWKLLSFVHTSLGQLEEALLSAETALKIDMTDAQLYAQYGTILLLKGDNAKSILPFRKSIDLDPNNSTAYTNLGNALNNVNKLEEAKSVLLKGIALKNSSYHAYNTLGTICIALGEIREAEPYLKKAILMNSEFPEAHNNLGTVYLKQNKLHEAKQSFLRAVQIKDKYVSALYNLAIVFEHEKEFERALAYYEQAYLLSPTLDYLMGSIVHLKRRLAIWEDYDKDVRQITHGILDGRRVCSAFTVQSLIDDPKVQLNASKTFWESCCKSKSLRATTFESYSHKKLKIGYFSPDFRNHPVSHLTAEVYNFHDRSLFEIYAFSFGAGSDDEFTDRIKSNVDHFYDVSNVSDAELVSLSRSLEIDIAIDLAGFTKSCRPNIFAMTAAPIQVGYLGFLGSMGSSSFDFIIADRIIIPEEHEDYYSEKIVYLPSYQANDSNLRLTNNIVNRDSFGIPTNAFVFCCFNDTYKITPDTFASWTRILRKVKSSVLMIYCSSKTAELNLKNEIEKAGIEPERLIVSGFLDRHNYLARYRHVDLFLDTQPYNSGATASDALRMGVPIITLMGRSFASRMCASLLSSINLEELITTSTTQYENVAIELAHNVEKLKIIRERLNSTLQSSMLFDTRRFTSNLEKAYLNMQEQRSKHQPFKNIYIEDTP